MMLFSTKKDRGRLPFTYKGEVSCILSLSAVKLTKNTSFLMGGWGCGWGLAEWLGTKLHSAKIQNYVKVGVSSVPVELGDNCLLNCGIIRFLEINDFSVKFLVMDNEIHKELWN